MTPSASIVALADSITDSLRTDSLAALAGARDMLPPILLLTAAAALALLAVSLFLWERVEFHAGYRDLKRGLRGGQK